MHICTCKILLAAFCLRYLHVQLCLYFHWPHTCILVLLGALLLGALYIPLLLSVFSPKSMRRPTCENYIPLQHDVLKNTFTCEHNHEQTHTEAGFLC